MGISDFFKKEKEDEKSVKVNASSIPQPPKNPKGSGGAVPPPPPSFSSQDQSSETPQGGPSMPPPPPGKGQGPDVPSAPGQKDESGPGIPKPPAAHAQRQADSIAPSGGMPDMPPAPAGKEMTKNSLDDVSIPKPGEMGEMPPAPQPSKAMDLPEPPEEKFQFPEFEQSEINNLGTASPTDDTNESSDESGMDWTQSPEEEESQQLANEPEQQMGKFPTDIEESDVDHEEGSASESADKHFEGQEDHEDSEEYIENIHDDETEEETPQQGKNAIHTEDGKLYVNAEHYEKIFNSIREMKQGASSLEVNLHNYSTLATDQESNYDKIAMNINEIQEQILEIDTRLFEKG